MQVLVMMAAATALAAFDPPVDTAGPLTARITGPATVAAVDASFPLSVELTNAGPDPVSGIVRLALIDGWTALPGAAAFSATPGGSATVSFQVRPSASSYNAYYPVHAFIECEAAGATHNAHPVFLVAVNRPDPPRARPEIPWKPVEVNADSALALWRLPVRRTILRVFGEEPRVMPVGWEGGDETTGAYEAIRGSVDRGGSREALVLHSPWRPRPGTVMAEYPVRLPKSDKVVLSFANAIRDHHADRGEPPSDGVTFRVRVAPHDARDGSEGEVIYDRHTASKRWVAGEADLTKFAGREVRIQLESHPGPKDDTTCDESYWAEPVLVAGKPKPAPKGGKARDIGTIGKGRGAWTIRAAPGVRGLLDAAVELRSGSRRLTMHGFRVRVLSDALDDSRSAVVLRSVEDESTAGTLRFRHKFESWAGTFDLVGELAVTGPALRTAFRLENAPEHRPWIIVRIDEVAAGPWSSGIRRAYAGPGNVIEKPRAFSLGFDGHRLSTSFAGFDFANGVSLVQGTDSVPDALRVDPASNRASLSSPGDQTLTFIPCENAWEGARKWHDVNGLSASAGVPGLAGRFAFDLWQWDLPYAKAAEELVKSFRYGLTDAVVVWHNWQGHGYDYRLPDIWPPRGDRGGLKGLDALARACRDHGVLFAPHDNYIDYYPDFSGFSYDKVAFDSSGAPVKAWLNTWHANAQSYRSLPSANRAPLERNVAFIREGIAPTAYFIDVWSSIGPYDCWTRDGRFVDRAETRKTWNGYFAWIRDQLGNNAPQISESGHDSLIGFLDGAQTNHLRVGPPIPGDLSWCTWDIACADAERVPWFDAAHHDRFVLHGAGYPGRYEAGLGREEHGIWSDDYIATEVLTGHPAMVPRPFGRDVVRKYWLLHDLGRALALKRIESVEFAGGDIHRQRVRWEGGAEVVVNRGKKPWTVKGRVLPQYGWYARIPADGGVVEAAVERRSGKTVEWSRGPSGIYVNARGGKVSVAGVGTAGACRVSSAGGAVTVTPLPESKSLKVALEWKALPWKLPPPSSSEAIADDGSVLSSSPVKQMKGKVTVSCDSSAFSRRLR